MGWGRVGWVGGVGCDGAEALERDNSMRCLGFVLYCVAAYLDVIPPVQA